MDIHAVLDRARELNIKLKFENERLLYYPRTAMPPDLEAMLRQCKREVIAYLKKPECEQGKPLEWHSGAVAKLVEKEGLCIFWSYVFQELVAFVKDDSFRALVPAGVVAYTKEELTILDETSPSTLRLIHQAKKHGARVTSRERKTTNGTIPSS